MPEPSRDPLQIDGSKYTFVSSLQGRGQTGSAGFYAKNDNQSEQYLIKEDEPGICLAESLVVTYLPEEAAYSPLIRAEIAQLGNNALSIQPMFALSDEEKKRELKVQAFDVLVLGRKRDPKTIISDDFKNRHKVQSSVEKMSPPVKKQLAAAIYMSQLNGDESLHVGQFMVKTDQQNNITQISRIDLGAMGRYAQARVDFDPLHTSNLYQKHGQFRKDYVSFLLQNDEVKQHVLTYWKNTNTEDVLQQVINRFNDQINKLNGVALDSELLNFYKTLTKASKLPAKKNVTTNEVRDLLVITTFKRCAEMKAAAEIHIVKMEIDAYLKKNPNIANDCDVKNAVRKLNSLANDSSKPATERLKQLKKIESFNPESSLLSSFFVFLKSILGYPNAGHDSVKPVGNSLAFFKQKIQDITPHSSKEEIKTERGDFSSK
jgi:hypothetical protein